MRLIVFSLAMLISSLGWAQSKKELAASNAALTAQLTALKAEVESLKKPKEADLNNKHEKASYALGVLVGTNLKSQGGDSLNVDALNIGISDVFQNRAPKIDQQACMPIVQQYMQEAAEKKNAQFVEASKVYLDENRKKPGVKETASGLQYQVITAGKGKMPSASDKVTVHYTGKLTDGTVFDSSVERNEPATFGVSEVIPGWTEALQLMHEGDKWLLTIPYSLAYGERGAGQEIPPYSTLIFEVELIKVN